LSLQNLPKNLSGKGLKKPYQKKAKIFTPKNVQKNDMLRKKNPIRKRVVKKAYHEKAKIFTFFHFSKNYSQHVFEKLGDVLRIIFFFEKKINKKRKF
jgi:hypothetical protein